MQDCQSCGGRACAQAESSHAPPCSTLVGIGCQGEPRRGCKLVIDIKPGAMEGARMDHTWVDRAGHRQRRRTRITPSASPATPCASPPVAAARKHLPLTCAQNRQFGHFRRFWSVSSHIGKLVHGPTRIRGHRAALEGANSDQRRKLAGPLGIRRVRSTRGFLRDTSIQWAEVRGWGIAESGGRLPRCDQTAAVSRMLTHCTALRTCRPQLVQRPRKWLPQGSRRRPDRRPRGVAG